MSYLAIDTSSSYLTVACDVNGEKKYKFMPNCNLSHSVVLNKTIQDLLNECGKTLADFDTFVAVTGAGSFTGIRIGVSTVKAFTYALNKKTLGVTKFDVLAYNTDRKKVLALIDAKNSNYYSQIYLGGVPQKAEFINLEKVKELSKEYKIVADKHIDGLFDEDIDLVKGLYNAVDDNLNKATYDREKLIPLYVKKSQAEEKEK